MPDKHVDYDQIAGTYNRRFETSPQGRIAAALQNLAQELQARCILEVGCGTGRWLADLRSASQALYGLDLSGGMLRQARNRDARLLLIRGQAEGLPFPQESFDLVYCVNALHHFERPRDFIFEASRLLRSGGTLAVVGMDPRDFIGDPPRLHWYVYDYFTGTLETDLERFPSRGTILDWMAAAGFEQGDWQPVEWIRGNLLGRAVLEDPFIRREATSQLTLLSPEAYATGLQRIREALSAAEQSEKNLVFPVDIHLHMLTGRIYKQERD